MVPGNRRRQDTMLRRADCRSGQKTAGIQHQAHDSKNTYPSDKHPEGIEYRITFNPFQQSVHALDTALQYIYFILEIKIDSFIYRFAIIVAARFNVQLETI